MTYFIGQSVSEIAICIFASSANLKNSGGSRLLFHRFSVIDKLSREIERNNAVCVTESHFELSRIQKNCDFQRSRQPAIDLSFLQLRYLDGFADRLVYCHQNAFLNLVSDHFFSSLCGQAHYVFQML